MSTKAPSGWAKPPTHEYKIPLVFEDTPRKWLIYDGRVLCVGTMHPLDFERMVESHASNTTQANELLNGINTWDDYAKWYCLLELLKRRKITLYDSREAAEQTRAPVSAKRKRGKAA